MIEELKLFPFPWSMRQRQCDAEGRVIREATPRSIEYFVDFKWGSLYRAEEAAGMI